MRNLASDRSVVIKGAGKSLSLVACDRADYILEAEKHFKSKWVYNEVKFNGDILTGLVKNSNKVFNRLCCHRSIRESQLKYFT